MAPKFGAMASTSANFETTGPMARAPSTFPDGRKQVGQFRDGKRISDAYYGPKAPDSLRVEKGGRVKMVEMPEAEKPARRSSKGRKKK